MFSCYLEGSLLLEIKEEVEAELREDLASLRPEEAAVLTLLQERLSREIEQQAIKPARSRRTVSSKSQPEIRA